MGRGKEESGNGKHAISNSPTVFKIPRTVHPISLPAYTLPTKPNIRREKKSKNVPGEGKKRRGEKKKKKKTKTQAQLTARYQIFNVRNTPHAIYLSSNDRDRTNFPSSIPSIENCPFLSPSLFFSLPRKKKKNTCPRNTEVRSMHG